jgi:hypothetical protein
MMHNTEYVNLFQTLTKAMEIASSVCHKWSIENLTRKQIENINLFDKAEMD